VDTLSEDLARMSDHLQPRGLAMPDPLGDNPPRGAGALSYLLDAIRLRPVGRRALSTLSVLLFLGGASMFAYPLATDVYADQVVQVQLEDAFDAPAAREAYITRTVQTGDPLTKIVMPAIGVDALVVEGTSPAALRAGAGHYPTTPLPGEAGNVAIAGHRTTYGKPFNRVDELSIGEEIRLETPLAAHVYRVVAAPADAARPCPTGACWITEPTDWGVVAPLDGAMLTLTTCHPKGSARERLIIRAELVDTIERDAGGDTAAG
jgi:sortase A